MRVQVVTPWYPDPASVYLGIFVEQQVAATINEGIEVDVEVPHLYPAPAGATPPHVLSAIRSVAGTDPRSIFPSRGNATWIPAPVPARSGFAGRACTFSDMIALKREYLPSSADLVHAHLGVPTAAALLSIDDRPLVVTEHQSTLDLLLAEPAAREQYRQVVIEAAAFFVVSPHLRTRLQQEFGDELGARIGVMPNIVDLSDVPFSDDRNPALRSWIYVGALVAKKGSRLLLEAFAVYKHQHDPAAILTIVGDGDQRSWVESFAAKRGMRDSVRMVGALPRSEVGRHLLNADVMVHMSPAETFGIAALEAIGAGLPVISLRHGGAVGSWGKIEQMAGLLLPTDSNGAQVAEAITHLRTNAGRLEPRAARAFVEENYSPSVIGARLRGAYVEALGR